MADGLNVLFKSEEIHKALTRLASDLTRDYKGKNPLLIGVLKGSFIFLADLVRLLDFPLEIDFVQLSSYGSGTKSSGKIEVLTRNSRPVKDRHVIIVEDIIDTGLTTAFLLDLLSQARPASLRLCALTDKSARRKVPVKIDYIGFHVPDKFIVGYGIDWNEKYRNLNEICYVE